MALPWLAVGVQHVLFDFDKILPSVDHEIESVICGRGQKQDG